MANNTVLLRKADEYNKQRMELITQDYKYDKRIVKIRSSSRCTDSAYFCKNQKKWSFPTIGKTTFFHYYTLPTTFPQQNTLSCSEKGNKSSTRKRTD